MRILYLSCHSILEHDEVKLLTELGHYVFSPGAYLDPSVSPDQMRPALDSVKYDPEDVAAFHALGKPGRDNKELLTKEFVDRFDTIIVMHMPKWIVLNWDAMKHKNVVWRTIGQSISPQEKALQSYREEGLKIVRYSPRETTIPNYIGSDALVRFYKNPDEFGNWSGEEKRVITFAQNMQQRDANCNFTFFEEVTRPYPRGLYGPGNENSGDFAHGKQDFEELKRLMRDSRVYFYTGTHPASYTLNFMEAWMTGIPIVAMGPKHGNARYFPDHELYEIPDLIQNGINGFISDDPAELRTAIEVLLNNEKVAQMVSENARADAIKVFGKETVGKQWKSFLETL
jgi:glycosyltransferase involved in cell wall biosynthesis